MTIVQFDKPTCKTLGAEIQEALQAIAQKHGIEIYCGGGSFQGTEYACKVVCKVKDTAGLEADARSVLDRYGSLYGLASEHYGMEIQLNGKRMRFVGLAPGRSKFPLRFEDVHTGKIVLYTEVVADRLRLVSLARAAGNQKAGVAQA